MKMTQKIRIKKSQLDEMSDEDLRILANNLFKLEEANKNKRAEFYLERMTRVQEEMHKSDARFLCCWAGNRCLRGDQKIFTKRGLVAIRDIQENDEVVSFDQATNQFRYNRSSGAILKGSDRLVRVVHETGEFVAHEKHQILCEDGKYQYVHDLQVGHSVLSSDSSRIELADYYATLLQKVSELSPPLCGECDQPETQKCADSEGDYLAYSHLCDQQPNLFPKENQVPAEKPIGASVYAPIFSHRCASLQDNQRVRSLKHILLGLKKILFGKRNGFYLLYLKSAAIRTFSVFLQQLVEVFRSWQRLLLTKLFRHNAFLSHQPYFGENFVLRHPAAFLLHTSALLGAVRVFLTSLRQLPLEYLKSFQSLLLSLFRQPKDESSQVFVDESAVSYSRILSIEKLDEVQDYYDIQVNIDHNYVTEDGAIHHNSGKSTGAIMELRWRVLGDHPFKKVKVPIKALLVCTDFENHVNKVIEPKLQEWFPPQELAKATIVRNQAKAIKQIKFQNGSTIDIVSHEQDPMIFESSDYDCCVMDEPPPQNIFKAVWRGLTDRGGSALIAGTPIVQNWLIQEYRNWQAGNPDGLNRHFILGKTEDNAKNLGDGDEKLGMKRIQEFAAMLSPEEREARLNGQPLELQGLVFKSWSRPVHMTKPFDWPHDWPIIESIDPHPRKPAGCSWIGIAQNGSKILLSSGYLHGDVVELGEEILRYRESLPIKDGRRPRITRSLIDNAANAPLTGKSIIGQVRERVSYREELEAIIGPSGAGGPRIEAPPKSVAGKLEALSAWLTVRERDGRLRPDFYVFDTPTNQDFLDEIEGYVWSRYKNRDRSGYKDQPVKIDDDILDSVLQVALTYKGHVEKHQEIANIFKGRETYSGGNNGRQRRLY
jgi:hypothetical protein